VTMTVIWEAVRLVDGLLFFAIGVYAIGGWTSPRRFTGGAPIEMPVWLAIWEIVAGLLVLATRPYSPSGHLAMVFGVVAMGVWSLRRWRDRPRSATR
jgi:hypothetical protein